MRTQAKKILIAIIGGTVLLLGLAMVVLPGPALLVIPMGLAILATEFVWAQRWRDRIKHKCSEMRAAHRRKKDQRAAAW